MRNLTLPARLGALILPLFVLSSTGCDIAMADHKQKETAEWRKTWELQPGGRVEITNVNGKIDVAPSSGNLVEVVATKTASAGSVEAAREALGRIEISETASPERIRIETRTQKVGGGLMNRANQQVNYTVKLPAGSDVVMRTVNGGIVLTGLTGRIDAETTNGGVDARDISGALTASTTNGGLDVDLARLAGPGVKLSSTNGGIDLRLPSDSKATISARITNGGVSTNGLQMDPGGQSSRRRLDGRLNGGGAPVDIEGTNGGIRISAR